MAAKQVTIRDGVYDQIVADESSYVISDIDIEKTYFPREQLEDLGAKPKVKVVAIGFGAERSRDLRNTDRVLLLLPVQVAVQQRVDPTDTATIDNLVELVEQIHDSIESDTLVTEASKPANPYRWLRTDPLKDENDLIYSYEDLTERNVFNAVFTAFYQYIKQ